MGRSDYFLPESLQSGVVPKWVLGPVDALGREHHDLMADPLAFFHVCVSILLRFWMQACPLTP